MQSVVKTFVASASELQSSDLYMTIKTPMFTVPDANLNGVRCTAEFLDEIVANQDKYVGLPLCADVKNLSEGRYAKLGHCYDAKTGTFSSSIIGSFYKFEKEEREEGAALIGYARVMKRNKRICKAIGELFSTGMLKFSFEISCGSYSELEDGTLLIDAADNNFLEGMCIVSFPACPDAVAMELVAELNEIGKEADDMDNVIESAEVVAEEIAEETSAAPEAEVIAEVESEPEQQPEEVQAAKCDPEKDDEDKPEESEDSGDEEDEDEKKRKETAETYTTVRHTEIDEVCSYDSDTGTETEVRSMVEQTVRGIMPESTEAVAETEVAEEAPEAPAEPEVEVVAEEKEDPIAEMRKEIAELKQLLAELKKEKEETEVVAEVEEKKEDVEVNPFIAEITTPKRYGLLDRIEKNPRSMLDRA